MDHTPSDSFHLLPHHPTSPHPTSPHTRNLITPLQFYNLISCGENLIFGLHRQPSDQLTLQQNSQNDVFYSTQPLTNILIPFTLHSPQLQLKKEFFLDFLQKEYGTWRDYPRITIYTPPSSLVHSCHLVDDILTDDSSTKIPNFTQTNNSNSSTKCLLCVWEILSNELHNELRYLSDFHSFSSFFPALSLPINDEHLVYPACILLPTNKYNAPLYLGSFSMAQNITVLSHLGIRSLFNCTSNLPFLSSPQITQRYRIPIEDTDTTDLLSHLPTTLTNLHNNLTSRIPTLVHCARGASRSASIVIAYCMKFLCMTYEDAFHHVHDCREDTKPNRGFVSQLKIFESYLEEEREEERVVYELTITNELSV
jgi:hypothetical protein